MWVRIEGKGVSVALIVVDEIDHEIIKLAILLAAKRAVKKEIIENE